MQKEFKKIIVDEMVDSKYIDKYILDKPTFDLDVSENEINKELQELEKKFTKDKYKIFFTSCQNVVVDSLLSPMGLSRKDLSDGDRDFDYNRKDWTQSGKALGSDTVSHDTKRKHLIEKRINNDGTLNDELTGISHNPSELDLDHPQSLKKIHDKGGFMFSKKEKVEVSKNEDNLVFVNKNFNRKKGSKNIEECQDFSENIDQEKFNVISEKSKKVVNQYIPESGIEKANFIIGRGVKDGVKIGSKQGLQVAMTHLTIEVINSIFDEVKDIIFNGWNNSKDKNSILNILLFRLNRIKNKILKKWKGVKEAFISGSLSGFLSAIISAVINLFRRTSKNIVRIIREGFLSLFEAIKIIVYPPRGMSIREASHEASKILATGLVITGGILATESIAVTLNGIGIPFAGIISTVIGSLISGLGSLFVIFLIDKVDLLGVVSNQRSKFISKKTNINIEKNKKDIKKNLDEILKSELTFN